MEIFNEIIDSIIDALKDTAIVAVFLYAAYWVIGLLERGAGRRMVSIILTADKIGPLAGGLLGALPSCGFSAAASNLYSVGVLTSGTLLSVYLATSDEMLAVMLSNLSSGSVTIFAVLKILAIKVLAGIIYGFLVDGIIRLVYYINYKREEAKRSTENDEELADEAYECGCGDPSCAVKGNLFLSALKRTLRIVLFIFLVTLAINILFVFVSPDIVASFANKYPIVGCVIAAFAGLIPNCAVSVFLTEFYLNGIISAPVMLCGLMTGAGSGLLVLFNRNMSMKENIFIVVTLLIGGLVFGYAGGMLLQII